MDIDLDDDDGGGGEAAWMATFADLSTLLLTFFVLLLSFASIDIVEFRMALGSVKDALGVQFEHHGDFEGVATSPVELSKQESTAAVPVFDELQLLKRITDTVEKKGLSDMIETELGERGVIVRVKGQVLFAGGESDLRSNGSAPLDSIVDVAKAIPFPVLIEGHTDDRPIRTREFRSNWELSTSRATVAMRYIVERGIDVERLGVAGYAHMRPLVPNDSTENRSRNRRVEFVFVTPVGTDWKTLEAASAVLAGADSAVSQPATDDTANGGGSAAKTGAGATPPTTEAKATSPPAAEPTAKPDAVAPTPPAPDGAVSPTPAAAPPP